MKRKTISLLLATIMMVGCLSACGQGNEATKKGSESSAPVSSSDESSKDLVSTDETVKKPDGYPTGTISLVVPAAAGAANDLATRAMNDALDLGGNAVIENIVGASQTIGSAEVAQRKADGQSLLTCANVGMILMPITSDLTYGTDDFRHIAMLTSPITMTVCVSPTSDIKSAEDWNEFVTSGKTYTYSHAGGVGGLGHVAAHDFLGQLGSTTGQFVAYNGSAEVMTALLNGEIDWAILDESDASTRSASGEVVPLYVIAKEAGDHTKSILPNVPCLSEIGVENMEYYVGLKWIAIRKDTPNETVEWIKQQLNEALQSDEYQNWLDTAGYGSVREYSEEEITDLVQTSYDLSKEILENMGMAK